MEGGMTYPCMIIIRFCIDQVSLHDYTYTSCLDKSYLVKNDISRSHVHESNSYSGKRPELFSSPRPHCPSSPPLGQDIGPRQDYGFYFQLRSYFFFHAFHVTRPPISAFLRNLNFFAQHDADLILGSGSALMMLLLCCHVGFLVSY